MSYDLVVFDPRPDLRDPIAFENWFRLRTKWADGLDYHKAENATPGLRAWLEEMTRRFPPMNRAQQPPVENELDLAWETDYSVGNDFIYAAFQSSKAAIAHETAFRLAAKHHVGFHDSSGRGDILFPTQKGTLEIVHAGKQPDSGNPTSMRSIDTITDRILDEMRKAKLGSGNRS